MHLTIYTDGGSLNNPGEAASAFVIYHDGKVLHQEGKRLGIATNNEAEYTAMVLALEKVIELQKHGMIVSKLSVFSDSALMVNQLNGLFKVTKAHIREFIMKIRILEQEVGIPVSYTHVLREKNQLADSLVKKALGR